MGHRSERYRERLSKVSRTQLLIVQTVLNESRRDAQEQHQLPIDVSSRAGTDTAGLACSSLSTSVLLAVCLQPHHTLHHTTPQPTRLQHIFAHHSFARYHHHTADDHYFTLSHSLTHIHSRPVHPEHYLQHSLICLSRYIPPCRQQHITSDLICVSTYRYPFLVLLPLSIVGDVYRLLLLSSLSSPNHLLPLSLSSPSRCLPRLCSG